MRDELANWGKTDALVARRGKFTFGNCPECEEQITSLSGNVTVVSHSSFTLSRT